MPPPSHTVEILKICKKDMSSRPDVLLPQSNKTWWIKYVTINNDGCYAHSILWIRNNLVSSRLFDGGILSSVWCVFFFHVAGEVWNPKSPLLIGCHSLMAMLAFCDVRGCVISTSSYVKYFLPWLNRRRLTIRPKILFVPRVSQQYGYVSLLCGQGCVVSITSYVDFFTRVKSSETNDMTLPWWHLEWLGI